MTTMRVVGVCFFWYQLTRVFPDKFQSRKTVVCVCVHHRSFQPVSCIIIREYSQRTLIHYMWQRQRMQGSTGVHLRHRDPGQCDNAQHCQNTTCDELFSHIHNNYHQHYKQQEKIVMLLIHNSVCPLCSSFVFAFFLFSHNEALTQVFCRRWHSGSGWHGQTVPQNPHPQQQTF